MKIADTNPLQRARARAANDVGTAPQTVKANATQKRFDHLAENSPGAFATLCQIFRATQKIPRILGVRLSFPGHHNAVFTCRITAGVR